MYALLIYNAIFHPIKLSRRIKCQHEEHLHSHMIDGGMDKRYWCTSCNAAWAGGGLAS